MKPATIDLGAIGALNDAHDKGKAWMVLNWRWDPAESFSDFALTILSREEGEEGEDDEPEAKTCRMEDTSPEFTRKEDVYNVHKALLAVQSPYFSQLFRLQTKAGDMQSKSIRITMNPLAAAVVPVMLDFLYFGADQMTAPIERDNAVAVRTLAKHFGLPGLFQFATEFINGDLSEDTLVHYLLDAQKHKDDVLVDALNKMCAENLGTVAHVEHLSVSSLETVAVMSPTKEDSQLFSRQFARYIQYNIDGISPESWHKLTSPEKMPTIDPEAALCIRLADMKMSSQEMSPDTEASVTDRCLDALATQCYLNNVGMWKGKSTDTAAMPGLPLEEKVVVLERALQKACTDVKDICEDMDALFGVALDKGVKSNDLVSKLSSSSRQKLPFNQCNFQKFKSKCPSLLVSGAGIKDANGLYKAFRLMEGRPVYRNHNGFSIWWYERKQEWVLGFSYGLAKCTALYTNKTMEDCQSAAEVHPVGDGWTTFNSSVDGPAPTVVPSVVSDS